MERHRQHDHRDREVPDLEDVHRAQDRDLAREPREERGPTDQQAERAGGPARRGDRRRGAIAIASAVWSAHARIRSQSRQSPACCFAIAAAGSPVRIGDSVAVFAQGPIGLCAVAGAKLSGASLVIGVDSVPSRLEFAKRMGADVVLDHKNQDVVAEIRRLTGGGADVTIEALGRQETFENALRSVRPGGTVSSLSVYSGHLQVPLEP